jgi:LPXTG-motif cell wall-anchored protein
MRATLATRRSRCWSWRAFTTLAAVGLSLLSVAVPLMAEAETRDQATSDLLSTMQADPELSTFVRLLGVAGLNDTLRGSNPLTVWAPTNSAFTKLAPGVLAGLTAQPAVLRDVLSYHLAPTPITAAQIVQMPTVTTLEGQTCRITASGGAVHINDTTVTRADVLASNGIIHVIDGILIPPSRVGSLPSTGDERSPVPALVALGTVLLAGGLFLRTGRQASGIRSRSG